MWSKASRARSSSVRYQPVLTAWDLYALIRKAYRDRERKVPEPRSLHKVRASLGKAGVGGSDRDYRSHYRVVDVPDQPADDIICLIDRFCHISHLSAMQSWGLTDRQPHELIITRPDNRAVNEMISGIMSREADEVPWEHRPADAPHGPFRLSNITHPERVRGRAVRVRMSRIAGESIRDRNGYSRVATIGQTFLDMIQHPGLCGGMAHVLEVWDEHAITYLDQIIAAVSSASSVVKCRAGYIIEERLGMKDPGVEEWHDCAQRGGSSRLDPSRPYLPQCIDHHHCSSMLLPGSMREDVMSWDTASGRQPISSLRPSPEFVRTIPCISMGGLLLGLVHNSPRMTRDMDFTAGFLPQEGIDTSVERALNKALPLVIAELGYAGSQATVDRVKVKSKDMDRPLENASFPALKITVQYVSRSHGQQKTDFVPIDLSFNEIAPRHVDILGIGDDIELHAYSPGEVIAEKYRALLQQAHRKRGRRRRQDIYDIDFLLGSYDFDVDLKVTIHATLVEKCHSRGIAPDINSLDNPEIRAGAGGEWATIELETGALPEFDHCFESVRQFYRQLPWGPDLSNTGL